MTISIIGAGYVGLVTAAVFSDLGNNVYCIDIDDNKIKDLKNTKIPFWEPQLEEYVKRNTEAGRLTFTTSYKESIKNSQIVFICVGTPPKNNGEADLSYVFSAIEQIAKNTKKEILIVIKSTVPIGFEKDFEKTMDKYAKTKYEFAASPEFLKEGTAIEDTLNPDRIVIGTKSKKAQDILLELHKLIPGDRILTNPRSAQLIKYASNAYLATKISFANALSIICEKTGADVEKVMQGIGADARIGHHFLKPGVGYGGSCLPKDVMAFIAQAKNFGYDFSLLSAVNAINLSQIDIFIEKILEKLSPNKKNLSRKEIAILGLAFKPNTDDMREAPSIKLIERLTSLGAKITAYDPKSMEVAKKILPAIKYANDAYSAVKNKDAMFLVTDWQEFTELDFQKIKKLMKSPIIIDGRNLYNPKEVTSMGFEYIGVGR